MKLMFIFIQFYEFGALSELKTKNKIPNTAGYIITLGVIDQTEVTPPYFVIGVIHANASNVQLKQKENK